MTRAVVVGHRGMLGSEVLARLREAGGVDAAGIDVDELDIRTPECCESALFDGADAIFNCAAYTDVDGAESDPESAFAVNRDGVAHLASAALRRDALLVHVSTDFVFDGKRREPYRPDDAPAPLGAYAKSKAEGEAVLLGSGCRFLLVRTSWLFGRGGRNFVDAILAKARMGVSLTVVCDQTGRPTYAPDLAQALLDLWGKGCDGIFHFANSGVATWHQFACEIVRQAGLRAAVLPCTTEEYPRPARRPSCSVLDLSATADALGHGPRPWTDALADYLNELDEEPGDPSAGH